jgi:hypothetical protein
MMTGDGGHYCIQPRLLRRSLCPEVREDRSVDRMLAASLTSSQHLLKAVGVLAEVMQQPGKIRKACESFVRRAGR